MDCKNNYKNRNHVDMFCSICRSPNSLDSQEHLLICPSLVDADMVSAGSNITYGDLFCDNVKKQEAVATILEKRFTKRKQILKET